LPGVPKFDAAKRTHKSVTLLGHLQAEEEDENHDSVMHAQESRGDEDARMQEGERDSPKLVAFKKKSKRNNRDRKT